MSKPFVVSEIEIPFAPKDVKNVFLDFEHFAEIKSTMIPEIKRKPGVSGPVLEGEFLDIDFGSVGWGVTHITKNTSDTLSWYGTFLLNCGAGKHTFYFLPSEKMQGHTTFRHEETPYLLSRLLFLLAPIQKIFDGFCVDFKARCEVVLGGGGA